jgi:hypothetical protein
MKILSSTRHSYANDDAMYVIDSLVETVSKALPSDCVVFFKAVNIGVEDIFFFGDELEDDTEFQGFVFAVVRVEEGETAEAALTAAREALRDEMREQFGKTVRQARLF